MADLSLNSKQQRQIEKLIRNWSTKFTWKLLTTALKVDLGIEISRQSLCTYKGIKNEYDTAKNRLNGASSPARYKISQSDVRLVERVEKLEVENALLTEKLGYQYDYIKTLLSNANEMPHIDLNALTKPRS